MFCVISTDLNWMMTIRALRKVWAWLVNSNHNPTGMINNCVFARLRVQQVFSKSLNPKL